MVLWQENVKIKITPQAVHSHNWPFPVLHHHVAAVTRFLNHHCPIPAQAILLHMVHSLHHQKLEVLLKRLFCHLTMRVRVQQMSRRVPIMPQSICRILLPMKENHPRLFSPASPVKISGEASARTSNMLCRAKYFITRYLSNW